MNKNASKKTCKKCKIEKVLDQFYFRKDQNRYLNICFECQKSSNKAYYAVNKCELLEYQNNYYNENKEFRLEYQNQYYENNKEEVRTYQKEYQLQNKDEILESNKIYYKANKEAILLQKKDYRIINHDRIIKNNLKYKKQKRINDPSFKLRENVSRMIVKGLKINKSSKNGLSCIEFLNYSFIELQQYLEKQFEPWMNWYNHGKYSTKTWNDNDNSTWTWQLDHIIPQSNLPYSSMEDDNFKKCWALSNLRPYSAKQNLLDGVSKIRHIGDNSE